MNKKSICQNIDLACGNEPCDFTSQEKQYILHCQSSNDEGDRTFLDGLLFWFESTASDGCWTQANVEFMHGLY
ncbi:hypothetical protein C7Y66_28360 [Chroococcidiopsis sp. CCALA 051]|jgi:hypothetical protein|nr:hypothetical protein C7Y66_28360 [Chroococcidiopsis sp. CCALA 051]